MFKCMYVQVSTIITCTLNSLQTVGLNTTWQIDLQRRWNRSKKGIGHTTLQAGVTIGKNSQIDNFRTNWWPLKQFHATFVGNTCEALVRFPKGPLHRRSWFVHQTIFDPFTGGSIFVPTRDLWAFSKDQISVTTKINGHGPTQREQVVEVKPQIVFIDQPVVLLSRERNNSENRKVRAPQTITTPREKCDIHYDDQVRDH